MPFFIKVHRRGIPVWVNVNHIVSMGNNEEGGWLAITPGDDMWIDETVEAIKGHFPHDFNVSNP